MKWEVVEVKNPVTDVIISNVPSIVLTGKPKASSEAYALATAIAYQHPYQHEDLNELAQSFGMASLRKTDVIALLDKYVVNFLDLQPLVDEATSTGNWDALRHEIASENRAGVLQVFLLASDSKLALSVANSALASDPNAAPVVNGPLLHAWSSGQPCALVRCGYETDKPNGLYRDPFLSALPYPTPTPVMWGNVIEAGVLACIAILPSSVREPVPADFRYFGGLAADGSLLPDNNFPVPPVPVKSVDVTPLIAQVQSMQVAHQQEYDGKVAQLQAERAASDERFSNLIAELSKA